MNKPRIVIAGGSGFIGQHLSRYLADRGYAVVILSRSRHPAHAGIEFLKWDGRTVGAWHTSLDGAVAVVNLAGRNVNCRYTPRNRREIDASRVDSVNAIADAIARCATPPRVWIQASSTAIYGDAQDRWCDETTPPGDGFPVQTCLLWERVFEEASARIPQDVRRVTIRISFVIGPGGGVLRMLKRMTQLFLGGHVGTGKQFISWIHVRDLEAIVLRMIEDETMSGSYNVTSPNPASNAEFMKELRRALHRPWSPPVPAWLAHVGAFFMRTEAMLALTGRRVKPARLQTSGVEFAFTDLPSALHDSLKT